MVGVEVADVIVYGGVGHFQGYFEGRKSLEDALAAQAIDASKEAAMGIFMGKVFKGGAKVAKVTTHINARITAKVTAKKTGTIAPKHIGTHEPIIPPKNGVLPAFGSAKLVPKKTFNRAGKLRKRWEDKRRIYEWDSRHGTLEVYNKRGQHLGEFCHKTGRQLKPAIRARNINP